jgi:cell division protein FtsL
MVVAVIPAGAYLFHQNECLELSYRVNALAREHQRLLEDERRLRVERARLESLERIERWARREHGLIRPDDDDVLVVGSPAREGDAAPDAVRRASNRSANAERSGRGEPSYR